MNYNIIFFNMNLEVVILSWVGNVWTVKESKASLLADIEGTDPLFVSIDSQFNIPVVLIADRLETNDVGIIGWVLDLFDILSLSSVKNKDFVLCPQRSQ